jgi:hypothetical protein
VFGVRRCKVIVETVPFVCLAMDVQTRVPGGFDQKNGVTGELKARVHATHLGAKPGPGPAEIWQPSAKF